MALPRGGDRPNQTEATVDNGDGTWSRQFALPPGNGGTAGSPNHVAVQPETTETKITAAAMPAGGVGFVGWLSAIWYKLTQTLSVGGLYNTAANVPTYTNGQQPTQQFGSRGAAWSQLMAPDSTTPLTIGDNNAVGGKSGVAGFLNVVAYSRVLDSSGLLQFMAGDVNGTYDVATASDQAAAGAVPAKSAAGAQSAVLKATAGNVYDVNAYSTAACLMVLIDATAAPSSGVALTGGNAPVFVMNLAAGASASEVFNVAKRFANGCVALFTTSLATYTPSATGFVSVAIK